jgi:hypothetical protein
MDLPTAAHNFRRAMVHCDNLIEVHRAYRKAPASVVAAASGLSVAQAAQGVAGRRYKEISVNRAVVVIAVAAWQAAVQDMTLAILDHSAPGPGAAMPSAAYNVMAGQITHAVDLFATPNGEKCRQLLKSAGFDPFPYWSWTVGRASYKSHEALSRLNQWVQLRHKIAHGEEPLPAYDALECVREANGPFVGSPILRLVDAESCVAFIRRMANLTGVALAAHLSINEPTWLGAP